MKKFLSIVLVLLFCFISFFTVDIPANAAAISLTTFNSKLSTFKQTYPNNSTFDDEGGKYGGYECFGFANCIAKYMFGSYPTTSGSAISNIDSNWKITHGGSAVDGLTVGDVVRYAYGSYDHSIFITSISGNTIYYCQANVPANTNKITYSNTISRDTLKQYVAKRLNGNSEKTGWVAHYKASIIGTQTDNILTVKYHANGGTIDTEITTVEYKVTDSAGLVMRSGAGINYSALTTLPVDTAFSITFSERKTADGFTWGKITYGGKTGWVVVSDFVKRTAINRTTDYYLYSSLVYRTSTISVLAYEMSYGQELKSGLYNAATFGLEREGYKFVGWSTTADASTTIFDQDDSTIKPETIYPNLKNGSATVILYAIWQCEHSYDNSCDTECNVCDEVRDVEPHNYKNNGSDNAYHWKYCDCGDIEEKQEHKFNLVKNDEQHWYECSCGKEKPESRYNHSYSRYIDTEYHWLMCFCGNIIDKEKHDFTDANCKMPMTCKRCGESKGEAIGHIYDNAYDTDCNVCGETRVVAKNGWAYEDGKWTYYIDDVKLKNCWKQDSTGWCYLGSDGYMRTNAWIMDSQGWCYVGADGYCVTNAWMKDSYGWCYLNAEGRMATNSWIMDSQGWCYVGADGYCVTNTWMKDSVGWCYLNSEGSMTKNAWVYDGGWYYLDGNGYMLFNTSRNIGGKVYNFNYSGLCTNP